MSWRMLGSVGLFGALLAGTLLLATMLPTPAGGPGKAGAHVTFPPDFFPGYTCRASALRQGEKPKQPDPWEPARANPRNNPCRVDDQGISGRRRAKNGIVTEGLLAARTEGSHPKRTVRAHAEAADIRLRNKGVEDLKIRAAVSEARVVCEGLIPRVSGFAKFGQVKLGDIVIPIGPQGPSVLPLGPLGTLYFNRQIRESIPLFAEQLTVRALELDTGDPAQHLVIAESKAGYVGNPCLK